MSDTRTPFHADLHTTPESIRQDRKFKTRTRWYAALAAYLTPLASTHFDGDVRRAECLAQQLAFVPEIQRGWGHSEAGMARAAEGLVNCYLAHLQAFTEASFPAPEQAALEALKDFIFKS